MFRLPWLLSVLILGLSACEKQPTQRMVGGSTMGTSWSLKVIAAEHPVSAGELTAEVQQTLNDIESKMSNWKKDSEVSRFNEMPAGCLSVSSQTLAVANTALEISTLSDGVFDITLGPLIELWGFGKRIGSDDLPTAEEVQQAKAKVGYQGISIDGDSLCKSRHELSINMSAIAKGYGVDRVAETLQALGYQRFLVEVGGELYAEGFNSKGKPWLIGVEKPVADNRQIMIDVAVALQAQGLATSGDYRNFFEVDGRRYSHLIDPTTGEPVEHQVASVSVLASSSMLADGWATAIQVMGVEAGLAIANELELAVLILEHSENGELLSHASKTWQFAE